MAKYIVTGGAGFIGAHVSKALLEKGHEVLVLDNLSTGKKENIAEGAVFHEVDLKDLETIKPLFEGVDGIFHFAAVPRVMKSIEDPIGTHADNLTATLNVLVAGRDAKVKRMVYSASCSAYGDENPMPLNEKMLTMPMSPYGIQKYVGEHYTRVFALAYGMETVSLRYFNVYGPGMSEIGTYVSVMSIFVRQKKAGEPLTITGDGEQTRDYTFIGDVVRANILAMESQKVGKGEVINIGNGNNKSVNYVAELFGGETKNIEARLEPRDAQADNTLARELLGWIPEVNLEEGVEKVKKYYGVE